MKRLVLFLITVVLCLFLCSCGQDETPVLQITSPNTEPTEFKSHRYASAEEIDPAILAELISNTYVSSTLIDDYNLHSRCDIRTITYTGNAYFARMEEMPGYDSPYAVDKLALVYQLECSLKNQSDIDKVGNANVTYYCLVFFDGFHRITDVQSLKPDGATMLWSKDGGWLTDSSLIDVSMEHHLTVNCAQGFNEHYDTHIEYIVTKCTSPQ